MAIAGPDDRTAYHEINVKVTSLRAWSEELHRLVGLTQAADSAVGHWSVNNFAGYGPGGADALRGLNADALATLAGAVRKLDDLIARLRDAAAYVAGSYADSDAYAKAGADAVRAGWSGLPLPNANSEAGGAAGTDQVPDGAGTTSEVPGGAGTTSEVPAAAGGAAASGTAAMGAAGDG